MIRYVILQFDGCLKGSLTISHYLKDFSNRRVPFSPWNIVSHAYFPVFQVQAPDSRPVCIQDLHQTCGSVGGNIVADIQIKPLVFRLPAGTIPEIDIGLGMVVVCHHQLALFCKLSDPVSAGSIRVTARQLHRYLTGTEGPCYPKCIAILLIRHLSRKRLLESIEFHSGAVVSLP